MAVRMTVWRGAAALALVVAAPVAARANGRFPATMSVSFQEGDDQKIFVGSTFGLLMSPDDGATWRWVCEQAIGYEGVFDPVFAVSRTGTIFATSYDGLSISRDGGCTFSFAGGPLLDMWTSDVQIGPDEAIWVTTSMGGRTNDVFVSRDDGQSFAPTGLLHERAWWKSIRIAPSNPNRIYVTGYQIADPSGDGNTEPRPLLYVTDNGGADWTEIPFSFEGRSQIFLLGVSPMDEDLVFMRVLGDRQDILLRSATGGVSWTEVMRQDVNFSGFVALPDGRFIVGTYFRGVYVSRDGGLTWSHTAEEPAMQCAGRRAADGELFSCGNNWDQKPEVKFALGRSTDGEDWSPVLRLVEIDGPLQCPDGSPQKTLCEPLWPSLAQQLGIGAVDGGPTVDGGTSSPPDDDDCGCGISLPLAAAAAWLGGPRSRRRGRKKAPSC